MSKNKTGKIANMSLHIIERIDVFTKSYGRKPTVIILGEGAYSILSREVEKIVQFKVSESNPILHFNGVEMIKAQTPENIALFPFVGDYNFKGVVNG